MSSTRISEGWRSSSSRLLGLYSLLFLVWSSILLSVMYFRIAGYLDDIADSGLLQRAYLFETFEGKALDDALNESMRYDIHGAYTFGTFTARGRQVSGMLATIPAGLPVDRTPHKIASWVDRDGQEHVSGRALAMAIRDGRILVLTRKNGKLSAVSNIILDALFWGVSLSLVPSLAGWYILRRKPLKRIQQIEVVTRRITAGDLAQRLPVSGQRDEIDRLSSIVNTMLERIEQLMAEVKGVCDSIAHDLRTPLTRLRARLYRIRVDLGEDSAHAAQIEQALVETDTLMARFNALLRVSELETSQRRSAFVDVDVAELLHELHQFYLPLAEVKQQHLTLDIDPEVTTFRGDPELLFEALGNLVSNAIRFTPTLGVIALRAVQDAGSIRIDVIDSGPGIPYENRTIVFQRFFREANDAGQGDGFGLGLSIAAAIAGLHGFKLRVGAAKAGGAWLSMQS